MVAFAAFFACVFYLDWAGGEVGEALAGAILFMFGGVGYAAPVLLFAAGAMIVVRPMVPALHPLKTGAACLICGAHARPRGRLARARPRRHAPRRLPRPALPEAPRRPRGRVALLDLGQAVLDRGLAHPVRLPAARRHPAAHRRVGREHHHRHARGGRHDHRAHAPHRHGRHRARSRTSRSRRSPRPSRRTASRSCARPTWRCRRRRPRSSTSTSDGDLEPGSDPPRGDCGRARGPGV